MGIAKNQRNTFIFWTSLVIVLIILPYFWRRNRDEDIEKNKRYTFCKILSKVGSLKNGNEWYCQFSYDGKIYSSHRSTHVDYDVKVGECYLVKFSFLKPEHNKLLYEFKLKSDKKEYEHFISEMIPCELLDTKENCFQILQEERLAIQRDRRN